MNAAQQNSGSMTANEIVASSASMELHGSRFASGLPDAVLFIKTPIAGPRGASHPVKTSARCFMPGIMMNRKTADDQGYPGNETA
jgi:hypothetical protein